MADDLKPDPVTVRRCGRPRNPEPSVGICVRLPLSQYDRLYRLATEYRIPPQTLVRRVVLLALRD